MLEDRLTWTDVVSGDLEVSSEDLGEIGGCGWGERQWCIGKILVMV